MFGLFKKRRDPRLLENDAMRARLAGLGDDGTSPRPVRHMIKPLGAGATNETVVRDFLVLQGLRISDSNGYVGLIFEEDREVASESFDAHIVALEKALSSWSWQYECWDSALR